MKDIIIVGAGGFGRELLQWIKDINKVENKWNIKGFIDDNINALSEYMCDYEVIGTISEWEPKKNEMFAISIDNKTKSRFNPYELPLWNNDENFLRFIANMEAMLPLKKASNIYKDYELLSYLHGLSKGCIGEAIDILKDASVYAIRTKSERISKKEIKESL